MSSLRPTGLVSFVSNIRIGARIYAGFCLVLLLLVLIAGSSWLGFQETTSGMETIQESSDAAITAAIMDGRTANALYFAQKFMAAGRKEEGAGVFRDRLKGNPYAPHWRTRPVSTWRKPDLE